jgi:hypothetical protein
MTHFDCLCNAAANDIIRRQMWFFLTSQLGCKDQSRFLNLFLMRRCGKTISESMFAAGAHVLICQVRGAHLLHLQGHVHRALRNFTMFPGIMYDVLPRQPHKVLGANSEQVATRATDTSEELFHHGPLAHFDRLVG